MLKIAEKIQNSKNPAVLAFFGDSITEGCFEFENGYKDTAKRPEQAFHALLKKRIERDTGRKIVTVNAGVAGNFSDQGLERIQKDVLDKKPDFCCVMFGVNDATNNKKGFEKYEKNMQTILQILLENEIETVLMTPNMIASRGTPGFHGFWWIVHKYYEGLQKKGVMDQYVEISRKVAREMNVPIADVYAQWKKMNKDGTDTTAMLINGLNHPAPEHHQLFADALYDLIFGE